MKCIQCRTDNNLKDRTGNFGRCKSCNHPFAFEPTTMKEVKITDPFFEKVINDISANNTLYFTPKQFLYFLDRQLKKKSFSWVKMVLLYIFFSIWTTLFVGGILSSLLRAFSIPLVLWAYNLLCIFYLFNLSNSQKSNYHTRQSSATALQILGVVVLVLGVIYSLSVNSGLGYFLTLLAGLSALWLGIWQKRRITKIPDSFLCNTTQVPTWLNTWERANGKVSQLLPAPNLSLTSEVQNTEQPPDVTAYSFDRLVVCNSAQIAQMLIANNFHFENNSAILSITGYPQAIFDTVLEMLRRNQNLSVYAFHDASPQGMRLTHHLRTSAAWFRDRNVTIIDLGLLPRQVLANPRHLFVHRSDESAIAAKRLEPEISQNLMETEIAWLEAGNFVELESFTPQQLIRILNHGIASSRELNRSDSETLIVWGDDSGSAIYAVESFG